MCTRLAIAAGPSQPPQSLCPGALLKIAGNAVQDRFPMPVLQRHCAVAGDIQCAFHGLPSRPSARDATAAARARALDAPWSLALPLCHTPLPSIQCGTVDVSGAATHRGCRRRVRLLGTTKHDLPRISSFVAARCGVQQRVKRCWWPRG